jgi:methionine-S-sulfoxide reductase
VGYAGGHTKQPTYEDVCSHTTGHAEVVSVEFDPARITTERVLDLFWAAHNPFRASRTGPDEGDQYRSAILFTRPEQETAARAAVAALEREHPGERVGTEIGLAPPFFAAEEYHQRYHEKHGSASCAVR